MGNGLNRVYLLGNVGQDPRYKEFQDGAVLNMRLATNEGYKDRDGKWVDHTEWHNVVIRGKRATGLSNYVKKGTGLMIVGKLRTRQWVDKDDKKNFTTEVIADEVRFVGGRKDDDEEGGGGGRSRNSHDDHDDHHDEHGGGEQATGGANDYGDDDIPF